MQQLRSLDEQIDRLKRFGLVINDEVAARKFLTYCNYCRFTEYGKVFKRSDSGYTFYRYNTQWEQIKALYLFDVELSTLIFNALLKIEVYFRNAIAQLSSESGDLFVLFREETYKFKTVEVEKWIEDLVELDNKLRQNPEVTSQTIDYQGQKVVSVPHWNLIEHFSFNQLAKVFSMLNTPYAHLIAKRFGHLPVRILKNWFLTLGELRNMCAHAKRVWNNTVCNVPAIPEKSTKWQWFNQLNFEQQKCRSRAFVQLSIVANIMQIIQEETGLCWNWRSSIKNLLRTQKPEVHKFHQEFGIPTPLKDSWESLDLWKE